MPFLYIMLIYNLKYINGTLMEKFGLDTTSKPKPVAGPDDLLLLLVQHWARDESVFPTEDDRHDVATIMLFQSYTGGRPAEFVHSSKGKATQDPLGETEEANKNEDYRKTACNSDDDDSDTGDSPEYDDNDLLDYDDDMSVDGKTDDNGDPDSDYNSDKVDITMKEDTTNGYTTGVDEVQEPVDENYDANDLDEHGEAIRKYKHSVTKISASGL